MGRTGNVAVIPGIVSAHVDEKHTVIEESFRLDRINGRGPRNFSR